MKTILQEFLFLDEKTGKFSSSKFMMMVTFYLLVGINIKALYMDREIKNTSFLMEMFMVTGTLYMGRRFSFKSKNIEASGADEKA